MVCTINSPAGGHRGYRILAANCIIPENNLSKLVLQCKLEVMCLGPLIILLWIFLALFEWQEEEIRILFWSLVITSPSGKMISIKRIWKLLQWPEFWLMKWLLPWSPQCYSCRPWQKFWLCTNQRNLTATVNQKDTNHPIPSAVWWPC